MTIRSGTILVLLFLTLHGNIFAQNDLCSNAEEIVIPNNGFALGTFSSSVINITTASVETGETFAPAITTADQNHKSVWFKLKLPTTRSLRISLLQSGASITAGDVGFAVYKNNNCLPDVGSISNKLTPITTFGNTFHPCVESGDYLVQVSGKAHVAGSISLQVESGQTSGLYDSPANAFTFSTLSEGIQTISYRVECQSLEDANEGCSLLPNAAAFTKSTWHVFTTALYFDYLAILLSNQNLSLSSAIGYKIYEGDVRNMPYTSLNIVQDCDSLVPGQNAARKIFSCGLLNPNTVYSLQLFFKETYSDNIQLTIITGGTAPTNAPVPANALVPPSNKLGVLPASTSGTITSATDRHACNSRHTLNACQPTIPDNGVTFNGLRYNLSSFFTFSILEISNIDILALQSSCFSNLLLRLYKQDLTNNCSGLDTNNLVAIGLTAVSFNCFEPGVYTLQVLGRDSIFPADNYFSGYGAFNNTSLPFCGLTGLGQPFNLRINVQSVESVGSYNLSSPGAYHPINFSGGSIQPLVNRIEYNSIDTFSCRNTVLPDETPCTPSITKGIYRTFNVADSGIIKLQSLTPPAASTFSKLYAGDANLLASNQNTHQYPQTFTGLTAYTQCSQYITNINPLNVCLTSGVYSYITFGDDGNVSNENISTLLYDTSASKFNNPVRAENLGDIVSLVSPGGGSIVTASDIYSCSDNAEVIDGKQPCSINGVGATKAIYRQFYLSKPASVTISADSDCILCKNGVIALFSGKATDGLDSLVYYELNDQCNLGITMDICNSLPAGWYTFVSYGTGANFENQSTTVTNNFNSFVGRENRYVVNLRFPCEGPKYNRPHKAAVDTMTRQPFLIEWGERNGSTSTYPKTDTTYVLYKEFYNCTVDTPLVSHPIIGCSAETNRVTYYVFQTTQDSYLSINTMGIWGAVYNGDVRVDSLSFATTTPIQTCLRSVGKIQICNLLSGVYTLVLFATDSEICTSVSPEIYIDKTGYSRFDHAVNAYDFGFIPADSTFYYGKPGDFHPLDTTRKPSDDIIYCTTGARNTDPNQYGCVSVNTNIYASNTNNTLYTSSNPGLFGIIARRNLWYTFVIDKPGIVRAQVNNRTPGKSTSLKFSIYRSDVDGNIPFSHLASSGLLDSTIAQGLTLVAQNTVSGCVPNTNSIFFVIDPCSPVTSRYFLIVDNVNTYPSDLTGGVQPNNQLDVAILFDSVAVVNDPGDFCNNPIVASLNGPGNTNASAVVNCHTIGSDFGEYNTVLTCPDSGITNRYKSTWFRIDIVGQDTLDVTLFITANTNVNPSLIKHRFMKGNCGAMEEGSCVQDILTQNTYKCLSPGSYYIQVLIPSRLNASPFPRVEGTIQLNLSAIQFTDACVPENNCLSTSNFTYAFNCNTGTETTFFNNSTFGSDITYHWNFGYNSQTSNDPAPVFSYPLLPVDQTYTVTLNVLNTNCGGSDSYSIPVFIPARPTVNLGNDTTLCTPGASIILNATSINGSTYVWQDGSTAPTLNASIPGSRVYSVTVDYNGCIARDAIAVHINPVISQSDSILTCDNYYVLLNSYRGFGETYMWNTGQQTASIQVNSSGTYINNIQWNTCEVTDTFYITTGPQAIENTISELICSGENYTLPWGVVVNTPGTYRDTIQYTSGCDSLRTNVFLIEKPVSTISSDISICNGSIYTLPWGQIVNTSGLYADTLKYVSGCDSIIHRVTITSLETSVLYDDASICPGTTFVLPWGVMANAEGIYSDTIRSELGCDSLINNIHLQITQTQPLQITKSNDIGCKLTSSILRVTGGTTYQWTPTLNLSDPVSDNPVASPTVTTVYYVESTSREGCALKDSIVVHVNSNSDNFYLIPSAFTPNNDGLNDCFGVKHWGDLTYLSFSIFNRWGELIFKSHNPAKCWDGRFKGKMQFAGSYVYQIYADGPCGKVFKKGTVVLIR